MQCKHKINKFMRSYDNTLDSRVKKSINIKDKKRLIRLENEIESFALEYKDIYKRIKNYIVPYIDFIQKYEKNIELSKELNHHINSEEKKCA